MKTSLLLFSIGTCLNCIALLAFGRLGDDVSSETAVILGGIGGAIFIVGSVILAEMKR